MKIQNWGLTGSQDIKINVIRKENARGHMSNARSQNTILYGVLKGPAFISKCSEKPGKVQNIMSSDLVCKEVTLIASSTRDQVVSTLLIEANYFSFVHPRCLIHVSIKIFVLLSLPWVAPATVQVPCRQNLALICPVPPP